MPLSVEKMKLNKDKKTLTVNKSLMLGDVTLEALASIDIVKSLPEAFV